MSATAQGPGPATGEQPAATPERHCRRCGSALAPEQEWCLACGTAATTEIAPPRGWRLPVIVAAALVAIAIAAAVLAIVELSRGPEHVTEVPAATPTPTPQATVTPAPTSTTTPAPDGTATPSPTTTPTSSLPDWPAGRSAWTIVLESSRSRTHAEHVAQGLQSRGDTVGLLRSDDHSSLNPGYWVVFSGQYSSRTAAEQAMSALPAKRGGAYVRRVSAT